MPLLPISHRMQRGQADCLAACAAMVLAFLQRQTDYDGLIRLLRIGPAGAPYRNLRYLEALGISVLIERGRIETLRRYVEKGLPPIVFVATYQLSYWQEATSHAVVVVGLDDQRIYLDDPAFPDAPKIVSLPEFGLAWLEMEDHYAIINVRGG